jgi:hypothetical protein
MTYWVCATCGVQHDDTPDPPAGCEICLDERQYVPVGGQRWTTLDELAEQGHAVKTRALEADLLGVGVEPKVAIGQRSLVVRTAAGGVLWDPTGFVDAGGVAAVRGFTDVRAIAASHPHFFGVAGEWSERLGGIPVYVPEADAHWVRRHDVRMELWRVRVELLPGVTLVQCGGHFPGSCVVHWRDGADGSGALLTGDTISVVSDRRYVTFMRSYPNQIPLGEPQVRGILRALDGLPYHRLYGGWWDSAVMRDAQRAVERSVQRYITWIRGEGTDA